MTTVHGHSINVYVGTVKGNLKTVRNPSLKGLHFLHCSNHNMSKPIKQLIFNVLLNIGLISSFARLVLAVKRGEFAPQILNLDLQKKLS